MILLSQPHKGIDSKEYLYFSTIYCFCINNVMSACALVTGCAESSSTSCYDWFPAWKHISFDTFTVVEDTFLWFKASWIHSVLLWVIQDLYAQPISIINPFIRRLKQALSLPTTWSFLAKRYATWSYGNILASGRMMTKIGDRHLVNISYFFHVA